jgi:hypothetical protein
MSSGTVGAAVGSAFRGQLRNIHAFFLDLPNNGITKAVEARRAERRAAGALYEPKSSFIAELDNFDIDYPLPAQGFAANVQRGSNKQWPARQRRNP